MDCIDSYESIIKKIGEGVDDKGNYSIMKWIREIPCECHPETCCHFDGKITTSSQWKLYADGSKGSV